MDMKNLKLKKYLSKIRTYDFIIFEIPILTVVWSSYMICSSQNRDLKYNRIVSSHLVWVLFQDPYFPIHFFKIIDFLVGVEGRVVVGGLQLYKIFHKPETQLNSLT